LPQAYGLVGAWAWQGGRGTDAIGTCPLAPNGSVGYDSARGLITDAASANYQAVSTPALRLALPLTFVWNGYNSPNAGARTANAEIFGVTYANTSTSPFCAYEFAVGSNTGQGFIDCNTGGTFQQVGSCAIGTTANTPVWLAGTMKSGTQTLYMNDPTTPAATASNAGAITYGTSPLVFFGGPTYSARDAAVIHDYGLIYNRALSVAELGWLYRQGRDLFARKRGWAGWTAALAAAQAGAGTAKLAGPGGLVRGRAGRSGGLVA